MLAISGKELEEKLNSPEIVKAARLWVALKNETVRVKNIIKPIEDEIFGRFNTTPEKSYLISQEDFDICMKEKFDKCIALGFKLPEVGYCPYLIAKHKEGKQYSKLCDLLEPITGISRYDAAQSLKLYKQYESLVTKMITAMLASRDEIQDEISLLLGMIDEIEAKNG